MTPYQKEVFAIHLDAVMKTCEEMLKNPDDIPEGWIDAIDDMRIRAGSMAEKWEQVKESTTHP